MAQIMALVVAGFGAIGLAYNLLGEPFPLIGDIGDVPLGMFFTAVGLYGYMA